MPSWSEYINGAITRFTLEGIDEADINANYLACHCLSLWTRSELRPFLDQILTPKQTTLFNNLIERRIAREPLQYIIGETEFFGLRLYCSPEALIPRAETEIIVEEALREAERLLASSSTLRILDIGTGSGAIILALASRLPNTKCIGIDISQGALNLAEKNKVRLGLSNVNFLQLDFLNSAEILKGYFDIIVSNPPYIPDSDINELAEEVKSFEPRVALTDGADGFLFYKQIAKNAAKLLNRTGSIIVETEFKGAPKVRAVFEQHGLTISRTATDLLSYERAIVANLTNE